MCAAALQHLGVPEVVFGAGNSRFGGCGGVVAVHEITALEDPRGLNTVKVTAVVWQPGLGDVARPALQGFKCRGGVLAEARCLGVWSSQPGCREAAAGFLPLRQSKRPGCQAAQALGRKCACNAARWLLAVIFGSRVSALRVELWAVAMGASSSKVRPRVTMWVVRIADFLKMSAPWLSHEQCLAAGILHRNEDGFFCIFVSHQWCLGEGLKAKYM